MSEPTYDFAGQVALVTGASLLALAAVALAGCESTQAKSARLERAAQRPRRRRASSCREQSRDVEVEGTTVLADD